MLKPWSRLILAATAIMPPLVIVCIGLLMAGQVSGRYIGLPILLIALAGCGVLDYARKTRRRRIHVESARRAGKAELASLIDILAFRLNPILWADGQRLWRVTCDDGEQIILITDEEPRQTDEIVQLTRRVFLSVD